MGKKGKTKRAAKGGARGGADAAAAPAPEPWGSQAQDLQHVAARLNAVAVGLVRRSHREDALDGLSSTRLSALWALVLGGPRALGSLAEAEGVTPPSMTRLVTAMEQDGLVTRSRSADDGRLVIVSATDQGADLVRCGRAGRIDALARLLAALPEADRHAVERATVALEELLHATDGA